MPLSKLQKSDFKKAFEYIQKKHLKGCYLKNGAASKNRTKNYDNFKLLSKKIDMFEN